ncbi:hypothetical protein F444_16936 [Phytophthora nicotianae P1976]|uniref:FYVE-type domain-containing protein n=1 Tax=Phytophthora nicotianae P1976 TaxID=1317066 RepID=A0A080ZGP2_PHYNI|nr:hypothetical protein F444_16936 [Phytophthora nicotianae P1976]
MPAPIFVELLPELEVTKADSEGLQQLEAVLVANNLEQYAQLLYRSKTKDRIVAKVTPGSKWHEIRKVEDLRIYEERVTAKSDTHSIPSIMMLGTVAGKLDDIMFGTVAATDTDVRIKERVLQDGTEQSKILRCLVQPTERDPFRQVSVKWQLYSTRDYVCLDTTGFARSSTGERVGYSLSHSIAFDEQLPQFDRHSIDRGNRSVCVMYRQRTPSTVECYARGFFDFETKNDPIANRVALQVIANQWLSHARITELAQMKKTVWRLKQQVACGEPIAKARKPLTTCTACRICNKAFRVLGGTKACSICLNAICSRCCVKRLVCVADPNTRELIECKRSFCARCIQETSLTDAMDIAKKEIRREADLRPSWALGG